jgi:hypothetical protein
MTNVRPGARRPRGALARRPERTSRTPARPGRHLPHGRAPSLHVAETHTGAIASYERLGCKIRRQVTFRGLCSP